MRERRAARGSAHAPSTTREAPTARPARRLAFVLLAGVVGGPVAGQLESSGGFVAPGADSQRAVERLEAATGVQPGAGVVVLVADPTPARVDAVAERLGAIEGVGNHRPAGRAARGRAGDRDPAGERRRRRVAEAALAALEDRPGVTVGGQAVAGLQIGETVSEDLGRAELIAFRSCCCSRCCSSAAGRRSCRSSSASRPCSARSSCCAASTSCAT
jgi:hypothetical protein